MLLPLVALAMLMTVANCAPVLDRHDAYGDALTTALCWIALESLPR